MWRRALQLFQRPTWGIAAPPETDSTSCIVRIEGSAKKISNLKIDISARPTWPISNFGNSLWVERNSCAFRARTLIPFGIGPPQHIFVPLAIENGNILTFEINSFEFPCVVACVSQRRCARNAPCSAISCSRGKCRAGLETQWCCVGHGCYPWRRALQLAHLMGYCRPARDRPHFVYRTH